ncbi:hypothetical protein TrVFT333_001882 [Trichoderma virens FT-333]|nr:hypothetical protein TrVFT333_001882 [Trichoderma virens FT-333]
MFSRHIVAAGFAAIQALASTVMGTALESDHFSCASSPSDKFREMSKQLAQKEAVDRSLGRRSAQEIDVGVHIHIVASSEKEKDGYLSDETVQGQLQVLNSDYEPAGISFSVIAIDRTINATWASGNDLETMWYYLHNGTYNELNIWFIPKLDYYGICTHPVAGEVLQYVYYEDGCTIRSDTVPGGNARDFNLGKTLTHEVGHWFGLLHTFEGGAMATATTLMIRLRKRLHLRDALKGEILARTNRGWIQFTIIWTIQTIPATKNLHLAKWIG